MTPAEVRRPAVAGSFYPRDPGELRTLVSGFLAAVDASPDRTPAWSTPGSARRTCSSASRSLP
jgi:AmmeMemoRadiSam system protein B